MISANIACFKPLRPSQCFFCLLPLPDLLRTFLLDGRDDGDAVAASGIAGASVGALRFFAEDVGASALPFDRLGES